MTEIHGFNLKGETALLWGLGKWNDVLASALAEAGADVAIASPRREEREKAAAAVKARGRQALLLPTRGITEAQVKQVVEKALAHFGKIDILVNNANVFFAKPLEETSADEWGRVTNANLTSLFLFCKEVSKHMLERQKGRIVNITSGLGVRGVANCSVTCATMGGVIAFTRALGQEWARQGIRINSIGLGWYSSTPPSPEQMAQDRLLRYIPLRRYGRPEDIGPLLIYLASPACDYTTGHTIHLEGGLLSHA